MDSAMKAINKALELSAEEKDEVGIAIELKQKAEIYFAMGNFNEAANYYNLTINYKDSIAIEEKKRETSRLIEEYESAKKQNEISTLQNEKRIQQLEIEKQQAIIRGNLESYRQKQSEIDLLNKENIISSLNLQNKKDELNRKTIEAASKELALNLSTQREKLKEREIINQKNTKNIIIYGSLLTLFLLGILFNQYRQSQRRKAEAETRDLQHQLSEMKIEALRAQMNPHFIFNALNSVNRYIIRSDVETASEYLVKFSKLMRLVLENSKSSLVSLHNEIEALRLYIELEQLRFDNKFSFTININESIDKDTTSIPPLILQPYVENAIWHGLMNKSSSGKVDITINKIGHNQLKCIIQDDGIGRKKANQFKSETLGSQRSFGTEITKERIKLLNGSDQNFKIIDLIDENSQPLGTRIEIILNTFSIK
ncbi:MAG: histidine kinase [Bacteroidetes bacterium]|nr:histidine kinase [Bacteroidota bacterium]